MKKSRGFTLIELMVVLTIIALLLSVVVPDYVGRMKRAEEAVLQENLTVMRDALDKHYADAGKYPARARGPGLQALPALDSRGSVHAERQHLGRRAARPIRRRAASSTCTAAPRAMSAGRTRKPRRRIHLHGLPAVRRGCSARGLAAYGELASHAAQREKEAELLFRGDQYRDAIASYYKKAQATRRRWRTCWRTSATRAGAPPAPALSDPITGETDWGLVEAPGGGVMGVYSKSEEQTVKSAQLLPEESGICRRAALLGLEIRP